MKIELDHLPENKRLELQHALEIIREEIDLEMLILFGSYARGDWVEDIDEATLLPKYQSDFDLLVVTETPRQAQRVEQNNKLTQRLIKTIHRTPVSVIAEDIKFVNKRVRKSQYFYIDILKDGIMLFDSGKFELAKPVEITLKERQKIAEGDFEFWYEKSERLFGIFNYCISQSSYNEAAFQLHQITECLYGTILLVFTRYKPSTHDLEKLGARVTSVETAFLRVFPQGTDEEKRRFELLRKSYVSARYNPNFIITLEELEWLAERVKHLQVLTESLCKAKIESFSG